MKNVLIAIHVATVDHNGELAGVVMPGDKQPAIVGVMMPGHNLRVIAGVLMIVEHLRVIVAVLMRGGTGMPRITG